MLIPILLKKFYQIFEVLRVFIAQFIFLPLSLLIDDCRGLLRMPKLRELIVSLDLTVVSLTCTLFIFKVFTELK